LACHKTFDKIRRFGHFRQNTGMNEPLSPSERKKRLTIVVPVYFNEENLPDTIPALLQLVEQMSDIVVDLVFVDDGSGDNSFAVLRAFQQKWPQIITTVRLSRNFGSMNAILAGLQVAEGDCVAMVAADLQDPPELLVQMHQSWLRGNKVVLAVRAGREEKFRDRLFASMYYWLLRRFALKNFPKGGFDLWLLDRQVVEEIKKINEKNTHLSSLIVWLGHQPAQIPYVRRRRAKGKSRWTMAKKIKLFIDSFVAFSYFPVRLVSVTGFVFAFLSFLYAAWEVVCRLWFKTPVPGFASIVILITFTSGLQMIMLGTLGEYLWRALDEMRKRPPYVIDAVYPRETQP
jgi:dolichol-phosphate mannosyltransferase